MAVQEFAQAETRVERQEPKRIPFFDGLVIRADERQFRNNEYPIVLSRHMEGVDYNVGLLTIHGDDIYLLSYAFSENRAMLLRISRDGTTRIAFPEFTDEHMQLFALMQEQDHDRIHTPIDAFIYDGSKEGERDLRNLHHGFDRLLHNASDVDSQTREDLQEEFEMLLHVTKLSLATDKLLASKRLRNVTRGQETLLEWAQAEARGESIDAATVNFLRIFGEGDKADKEEFGDDLLTEGTEQYPSVDDHAWMGSGPRHRQPTIAPIPEDVEQAPLFRDETGIQAFVNTAKREIEGILDTQATFARVKQLGFDFYLGNGIEIGVDYEAPRMEFVPQSYLYRHSERKEAVQHVSVQAVRIDSKTNGLLLEVALSAGTYVFLCGPNSLSLLYEDETITLTDNKTREGIYGLLNVLDQQIQMRLSLRRSRYERQVARNLHRLITHLTH